MAERHTRAQSQAPVGDGIFVVPPFHSTSNPPVGLAYLVAYLGRVGIQAAIRDLNIEARGQFRRLGERAITDCANELFLQSQRSYLGEAGAWSWLDPDGPDAVLDRIAAHPSAEVRGHWLDTVGTERLSADPTVAWVMDALRRWIEAETAAIARSDVSWVGLSLTVSNLGCALFIARLLRRERPELTILLGGPHVNERNAAELLEAFPADAVIPASAYVPLSEILRTGPDHSVTGALRRSSASELLGDPSPRGFSVEALPFADWSGVDLKRYDRAFAVADAWSGTGRTDFRIMPLQTSRGCSYSRCEFCHNVIDHPDYLVQTAPRVVAELDHQMSTSGIRSFFFTDDEFNGSLWRVRQLTRLIEDALDDVRWFAWLRLDRLSRRALEDIYRSGCRGVFIGVEAVVDQLLAQLCKGYGAELAMNRLRLLDEFHSEHPDFAYSFNLIGCHPCETLYDVEQTHRTIDAEPRLFVGKVSAICEYHVYEGTPAAARFGRGAPGLLEPVLAPGVHLTSFRLMPGEPSDVDERRRHWREIGEIVTSSTRVARSPTPLYV